MVLTSLPAKSARLERERKIRLPRPAAIRLAVRKGRYLRLGLHSPEQQYRGDKRLIWFLKSEEWTWEGLPSSESEKEYRKLEPKRPVARRT